MRCFVVAFNKYKGYLCHIRVMQTHDIPFNSLYVKYLNCGQQFLKYDPRPKFCLRTEGACFKVLHPVNVFQSKYTRNLLDQAKPMDIFTLELTRHPDLNQIVKTQSSGSLSLF